MPPRAHPSRFARRVRVGWSIALLTAALSGCIAYRPHPLDTASVEAALHVPGVDSLGVRAARLRHPALAPVALDLADGLTPDEAAVVAVLVNPALTARRAARGVVAAQLFAEGLLPPPQLAASADFPVAGGDSTSQTALGLGLSLDLNALLTRGARVAAAEAIRDSTDLGIAYAEWQTAQQARLSTYRLLFLGRQRELLAQELDALKTSLDLLNEAERRRLITEVDRAAAEAAYRDARLTALDIARQEADERFTLVGVLGFPADTAVAVQSVSAPAFAAPSFDTLAAGLDSLRLDLRALRLGYASGEAGLRAAVLGQFPAINIGINLARNDAGLVTVGPAVSVGFPFLGLGPLRFDRNQGAIAVATATRAQLFAEYTARRREAEVQIAQAASALAFARDRVQAAAEAYATRRHLVEIYGQALLFGQADVVTYYTARVEAVSLALQVLQAAQAVVETGIALELAAGRPLAPSPGPGRVDPDLAPLPAPFRTPDHTP